MAAKKEENKQMDYEKNLEEIAQRGRTMMGEFPRSSRVYAMVIAQGFLYLGNILKKNVDK